MEDYKLKLLQSYGRGKLIKEAIIPNNNCE